MSLSLGCCVNLRRRYQLAEKTDLDLSFTFFLVFNISISRVEIDRLSWYNCHVVLILNATLVHADIRLCGGRWRLRVLLHQSISDELYHNITLCLLIALMMFLWRYIILLCFMGVLGMFFSIWLWHYSWRVLGLINVYLLLCRGQWSSFGIAKRWSQSWDTWYMAEQLRLSWYLVGDSLCCWLLVVSVGVYRFARHSWSFDLLWLIQNRSCCILLRTLRYTRKLR